VITAWSILHFSSTFSKYVMYTSFSYFWLRQNLIQSEWQRTLVLVWRQSTRAASSVHIILCVHKEARQYSQSPLSSTSSKNCKC
jgi:hypothetical protein